MVEYPTNTDLVLLASHISNVGQCEFILNEIWSSHRICSPPDLDSPHLTLTPMCWRLFWHQKVIWSSRSWSVDENHETSHYCGLRWEKGCASTSPAVALLPWVFSREGHVVCLLAVKSKRSISRHMQGWFCSPVSLQRIFQVGRERSSSPISHSTQDYPVWLH